MIESRHDLDEVIDRVAAKMVAVPEDAGLCSRTVARLPERAATPWFLALPAQLTAGVALVVLAFLYARPSREHEAMPDLAAKPVVEGVDLIAPAPVLGARFLPVAVRRLPTPDSRLPAAALDRPDHEHSLPPVDAVEAIELVGIATPSIDVRSAAAIEPIVLTELALDTEGEE